MTERTIAAVFRERQAAEAALHLLLASGTPSSDVSMAPAAIAEDDDGPIRRPVTLVAVRVAGDAAAAREILELHGGLVVADLATGVPSRSAQEVAAARRMPGAAVDPFDDTAGHALADFEDGRTHGIGFG